MRRIVLWAMSTLTVLVLLFSYSTSRSSTAVLDRLLRPGAVRRHRHRRHDHLGHDLVRLGLELVGLVLGLVRLDEHLVRGQDVCR